MQLTTTWLGRRTFNWLFFAVVAVTFLVMPITAGFALRQTSIEATKLYRENPSYDVMHKWEGFLRYAIKFGWAPLAVNTTLGIALAFLFALKLSKEVDALQTATNDMMHDLRAPLSNVVTRAESALAGNEDKTAALRSVSKSGCWMLDVYDENAEVLKNFAGSVDGLAAEEKDAAAIVLKSASIYKDIVEEKGVAFNLTVPDKPLMVTTYAAKFLSLVSNLMDNAAKYTDSGAVEVTLEVTNRKLRFIVKDTGPGMSAAEAEKAKMNLYRASSSSKKPGIGRGMTLVNSLASLLKGDFDFHPVEGEGTTCTVTLPLDMTRKPPLRPLRWLKRTVARLSPR